MSDDEILSIKVKRGTKHGTLTYKFKIDTWYRTRLRATDLLVQRFSAQHNELYAHGVDEDGRELDLPIDYLVMPSPLEQLAQASEQDQEEA